MRIKNKLFPYPILHKQVLYSGFKTSTYKLYMNTEITDNEYIIKNIYVSLNDNNIKRLYNEKKVKIVCVVECAQSMYRKTFEIGFEPMDIVIPKFDLVGYIEMSSFIYATEDINDYHSEDFLDDYEGLSISIEKNCIIAIDNGFHQTVVFDSSNDDKKNGIFVFMTNENPDKKVVEWAIDNELVKIYIPEYQHMEYNVMKYDEIYTNTFLSIYVVPVLTMILSNFIREQSDIDDLQTNYKWFMNFKKIYEKEFSKELTDEEFLNWNNNYIYEVVQQMFDNCVINSMDNLYDIRTNERVGDQDED